MTMRRIARAAATLGLAALLGAPPLPAADATGVTLLDTITVEPIAGAGPYPARRFRARGRPTLALALSGGGAHGLAHLGVLEALEEDGIEPEAVAGTSVGALLGAFIAAGYSARDVVEILRGRDWGSIISGLDLRNRVLFESEDVGQTSALVDVRLRRGKQLQIGALLESRLLERELYRYLLRAQLDSGGDFDHLRLRYRAVATDIVSGKAVVPSSGDLVTLVRGSFAIPGVFRPVPLGDWLLVDGGLVENVPVGTAKTLGTDVVLAVDATEGLDPSKGIRGPLGLLNRSVTLMMEAASQDSLAHADLVIHPDVAAFSPADFGRHLDDLVRAGRDAYERQRGALWAILEARGGDRSALDYSGIDVEGTSSLDADAIATRLGGRSGVTGRLRVAAELARILNDRPFASGRVDWVAAPGGKRLRFVLQETAPGPAGAPASAALPAPAAGPVSAPAGGPAAAPTGGPQAEMIVGRIVTETRGEIRHATTERFLADLEGKRLDFDRLADRLDEMVARGAIFEWSLAARRLPDDRIELHVIVRGDDYWEASAGGGYRGELGWAGYLRAGKSNITGRGDFVDLTLLGARDTRLVRARYRTEYGVGRRNLGAEAGVDHFDNAFPIVDADQNLLDDDETWRGDRAWASLIGRLRYGAVAQLGLARERDHLDDTPTAPAADFFRTSAFLHLALDHHDRLLFPTRGSSFSLRAEDAFAGNPLWKAEMKADSVFSLGARDGQTITLGLGVGLSQSALRRPFWFNPGGYRDLYGFVPYGAAAPQYARASAAYRARLFDIGAARIYVEAGADIVRTALERADLGAPNDTVGYGVSLIAHTRLLGPIALGAARNDSGAGMFFVTAGFPIAGD